MAKLDARAMAQFQIYRLPSDGLMLDLQTDLTLDIGTRVVAPLVPRDRSDPPVKRLEPVLDVRGVPHVLLTGEMAAVPSSLSAGPAVADLSGQDHVILAALEMVFSGF